MKSTNIILERIYVNSNVVVIFQAVAVITLRFILIPQT